MLYALHMPSYLQDAALQLSSGEYWELTVEQRVALLKCLSNLALGAEPVRDIFQTQAETLQLGGKAKTPQARPTHSIFP